MRRTLIVVAALTIITACGSSGTRSEQMPGPPVRPPTTTAPTTTTVAPNATTTLPQPPGDRYVPPAPSSTTGCIATADGLPDARCTPGATDPRVTQATIDTTICVPGYTGTVRPPTSVTTPVKRERIAAYGDTQPLSFYELDHLIPLELGGAPNAIGNFWPEPWTGTLGARTKDHVENALHADVCSGKMPLAVAQQAIAANWMTTSP